jgi:hydroxypyruvate isomerase
MVYSAHLSMLFRELPYLERPAAAAAAGFGVVESWWPGDDLDEWLDEVHAHSLEVRSLNCDCGDIEAGDRGFLNVPERREATLAAFTAAVAAAARCGAPFVHLLVGRDTGAVPREEQLAVAARVVAECAGIARAAGIRVLIEPINDRDVPGYLVTTPAEALGLIEAAGADDVLLLYDAYHAARMGADPLADVTRWLPRTGHVHYADCPGRGAPGTGALDLTRFVDVLERGGYDGVVGLELDPGPSTPAALGELVVA